VTEHPSPEEIRAFLKSEYPGLTAGELERLTKAAQAGAQWFKKLRESKRLAGDLKTSITRPVVVAASAGGVKRPAVDETKYGSTPDIP
jgi:hypothetical protein